MKPRITLPSPHALCASLGLAALAATLLPASALASHVTMSGDNVDLTAPCLKQISISVDPTLKDGASLDSSNGAQVTIHDDKDGAESRITIATRACEPNGRLILRLAPDTGLSIHDSHDSHITIKGTLSSLDASLDSNTLDVARVQSLDLSMHGNSAVHIASLNRAAQIVASGTSTFIADDAQLSALSAQLTNSTTFNIGGGTIEALTVVATDQARATILGTATVATVTANGSGIVNIEKVSGPIVRSGTGSVRVGAPNGEIYRPGIPPGPGVATAVAPPPQPAPPQQSTPVPPDATPTPGTVTTPAQTAAVPTVPTPPASTTTPPARVTPPPESATPAQMPATQPLAPATPAAPSGILSPDAPAPHPSATEMPGSNTSGGPAPAQPVSPSISTPQRG